MMIRCLSRRAMLAAAFASVGATARGAPALRIGVLKFGTAAWQLDVMARHDLAGGLAIELVVLATSQATQTALQAGSVDMIVQDWLWVSRLRTSGRDWTFSPFSASAGVLVAPPNGEVHGVADLVGKRLGVAGTPLDYNWFVMRAYAQRKLGLDLAGTVSPAFAAPPLLSEQLRQGRLDAVLTYWPEAARLQAAGMTRILSVQDAITALGVGERVPITGYVFSAAWATAHRDMLSAFLAASARARTILEQSDAEWDALAKLTGAANPAELAMLRDAYRAGIPGPVGADTIAAMGRLYAVLEATGAKALVGDAPSIAPGTFWSAAT